MTLSNQAIGALMMALQKSLMEQTDIVPMLAEMDFVVDGTNELSVTNPPVVSLNDVNFPGTETVTDSTVLVPEE